METRNRIKIYDILLVSNFRLNMVDPSTLVASVILDFLRTYNRVAKFGSKFLVVERTTQICSCHIFGSPNFITILYVVVPLVPKQIFLLKISIPLTNIW